MDTGFDMASAVASTSTAPVMGSVKKLTKHKNRHSKDSNGSSHRNSSRERNKSKHRRDSIATSSEKDSNHSKDVLKSKKISGPKESAFRYLYPIIDISIPPALINDPHRAAEELMDTLLMRYVPQMSGVLLSHHNITFLRQYAKIDSDGAYSIIPAGMTCLVWAPEIGMRLEGQIQLSTPSHISLLVHGIFNASITSAHLPSNMDPTHSSKDTVYQWHEFQNGEIDVKMEDVQDGNSDILADDGGEKSTGYWVSKETGQRLGGKDGKIVFTVVGMTVANHMLSIFGSLLRKPFSIAAPTYVSRPMPSLSSIDKARRVHFEEEHQRGAVGLDAHEIDEEEEGNSDDDELPTSSIMTGPQIVVQEKKKKRSKVGPRREGEISGSESEGETRREKKKRKKE